MKLMRQVVMIAAVLALAGCGASSEDELRQWMTEHSNSLQWPVSGSLARH